MRALQVQKLTGPDGLGLCEAPEPDPGDGALIEVHAAGVSFPDLLLSRGQYQLRPEPPFTLGLEAAGTILQAPAESGLERGQRVVAFTFGAFAERAAAPLVSTFPLPDELSFEEGAALVMNYHTALFALERRGRLRSGETVLVQGAAGGVGTAAVQVSKALGARVIGVVSGQRKEEVARAAGADEVVRLGDGWRDQIRELTDGHGVDVVYDPVGGERFHDSLRCLAPEGRLVVIGFAEGQIPQLAVNRILFRNVDVVGAAWGEFIALHPDLFGEAGRSLAKIVRQGYVRPIVGQVYALEDGPEALRALEERRTLGKAVLRVRQRR